MQCMNPACITYYCNDWECREPARLALKKGMLEHLVRAEAYAKSRNYDGTTENDNCFWY